MSNLTKKALIFSQNKLRKATITVHEDSILAHGNFDATEGNVFWSLELLVDIGFKIYSWRKN